MSSILKVLKHLVVPLLAFSSTASQTIEPARREFFYVGGEYKNSTLGNTTGQFMINQIYVEKLIPQRVTQPYPIVFIPGAGQTGTNLLETPDGRPGWSSFFLSRGYIIYLTDQPSRGRSPWLPSIGSMTAFTAETAETMFTDISSHNLWPQSKLHTQWPGSGTIGDPVFDTFFATQVQFQADQSISEVQNAKVHSALLDKIGPAYLLTHSQSGAYGWRAADARPSLVKAIVALEPTGPPFVNEVPLGHNLERFYGVTIGPIRYEPSAGLNATLLKTITVPAKDENHTSCVLQQEPAKKLVNLASIPVLVVTSEASYYAPYDYCTVEYLRQAGVSVEHADLAEEGIHGNGHLMFMEKNNLEIAERVLGWLQDL